MKEKVFVEELHKAYLDSGAYLNKANIDEPRWKQSLGIKKNYARLLATKLLVNSSAFLCATNVSAVTSTKTMSPADLKNISFFF